MGVVIITDSVKELPSLHENSEKQTFINHSRDLKDTTENRMSHITDELKWPEINTELEALEYINKVQAQFPRLQIFQLSFDLDGYVVAGKCGVLSLKKEKNE